MNGEEKPRQRRSDALINRLLETHFPTLFYTASALSAPSGLGIREYRQLKYGEAATSIPHFPLRADHEKRCHDAFAS